VRKINKEFLSPHTPLLHEVVSWLLGNERFCGRLKNVEGALSLSHIMVVVPTAQSGRNLRCELAQRCGGILPPKVVLPAQLTKPADMQYREATTAETMAAFMKFLEARPRRHIDELCGSAHPVIDEWEHLFCAETIEDVKARLSFFDQLSDIWRVLAGGGLLMSQVLQSKEACRVLDEAKGDEKQRWEELAELEIAFFDFLHNMGICHPAEAMHLAKSNPCAVDPEITEVVLPALADPLRVLKDVLVSQRGELEISVLLHADKNDESKFDDFGCPVAASWIGVNQPVLNGLRNDDIVIGADSSDMAQRVVSDFQPVEKELKLPSLALADGDVFPEIASAFLNAGYVVYNPECYPLAVSSLGRLVRSVIELYKEESEGCLWTHFINALRSDDVLKALVSHGRFSRSSVLNGIDVAQNRFLPLYMPKNCAFPKVEISKYDEADFSEFHQAAKMFLLWIEESRKCGSLVQFVREILRRIFARRKLVGRGGEDEFREAADCLCRTLESLESDVIKNLQLSDSVYLSVVQRALDAASYSLEPDAVNAVKTEGWLELPWSAADNFAVVGLHEGAVPDSLVGHQFIPDSLRRALGLVDNEDRLVRDSWILKELLDSHGEKSVRAYVAKTNNAGDICRPSRLLFLCNSEEFPKRVEHLFGDTEVTAARFPRRVADEWRLRLPDQISFPGCDEKTPNGRLSASAIDQYISCPFTYLFKFALKMKKVEEKKELGFDDFGTLVHKALEEYAKEQIARGDDQLTEESDIGFLLEKILKDIISSYGKKSVNVSLQLEALSERVKIFAGIQSQWAKEGWKIVECPEYRFLVQPFLEEGEDVWIKGSVDRIDYNPNFGYRIIDYKTWDTRSDISKHIITKAKKQIDFSKTHNFPLYNDKLRIMSVQLPLYAKCLSTADEKFAGKIVDMCYLVLGEDKANACVYGSNFDQKNYEAQKKGKVKLIELTSVALETALIAVRHIKQNIFWPPGPSQDWKNSIKDLMVTDPEKDMGADMEEPPEWLKSQLARLMQCEKMK
jgi:hypothetical protein